MILHFPVITSYLTIFISLAYSKEWGQKDYKFIKAANEDIKSFHKFLHALKQHSMDQDEASSNHDKGAGYLQDQSIQEEKFGFTKSGGEKKHHVDKGKHYNSEIENKKKKWGENKGVKSKYHKGKNQENHHHNEAHHHLGDVFKDAHKYNNGNYEKGFREKYHLDEIKKHQQFWKNLDTHKKWKSFGNSQSEHDKESKGKHKTEKFKEGADESEEGDKGKNKKIVHSTQKQGYKKDEKEEISYAHEKNFHKV
ncbi:uncharacterized protein LOC142320872 [Lycorma delicatula]|uniref:uncharacterized protein LOC142320872 n=1 Tax=Lycorma delicatula TaxID=130591 RepID=UPI003F517366